MANNWTQTSFYFRCGTAANAEKVAVWINGGDLHPYPAELVTAMTAAYEGCFDGPVLDAFIADAETDGDQVWIHLDGNGGDLEVLAAIMKYAMDTIPEVEDGQGFQWAEGCDRPRVNEFGGGACFIARGQDIRWHHTGSWLELQQV